MSTTCYVCGYCGESLLPISKSFFRHVDCYPGSARWLDYYAKLPKAQRTEAGNVLYETKRGALPARKKVGA